MYTWVTVGSKGLTFSYCPIVEVEVVIVSVTCAGAVSNSSLNAESGSEVVVSAF